MTTDEHEIRLAADADANAAAGALAAAFEGYPWTGWLVPPDDHERRLQGLFELTVAEIGIPYGVVWTARCPALDGAVVGALVAVHPDGPIPDSAWQALEPRQAKLFGDRLAVMHAAEEACAGLRPQVPHTTLGTIGVTPDHQRKGLATALMQPVLRWVDQRRTPMYLETSTEANVDFYQRLGFQVTGHIVMRPDGPPVWAMIR